MAKKEAAKSQPKKTRRSQLALPAVMTGLEVRKALGGVSHVTVHNLTFKGSKPLRKAFTGKAKGGGYLYHRELVLDFAKSYRPQRNPPPGKGTRSRIESRRVERVAKGRAARGVKSGAARRAVAGA